MKHRSRVAYHMGITLRLFCFFRFSALGLLAVAAAAQAQGAGPAQVARFDVTEGSVQFQSAADNQTRLADPRWPVSGGDRIWTAAGSRAELDAGGSTVRLGDNTDLAFTSLDERGTQLRLTAGTLGTVVRDVRPGERFEIDTPNLAVVIDRPGRWRVDVDPGRNTTRVSAEQGSGTLYGENGQGLPFSAPQSREFAFRTLAESAPLATRNGDGFDRWSDDRDRLLAQSPSLRYASQDIPGVQQLDSYGDWGNDPQYGAIWYPRSVSAGWSPYSSGHWEWIAPWGWTWIDDNPWGFAPFHYGRWQQNNNRWGWIPGPPQQRRPAYTAALPFNGARPRVPDRMPQGQFQGQPPMPRPMGPQHIGAPIEALHDQVQRDQWQQNQNAMQAQHQAEMQRQQQQREVQQRFQPSYEQNRALDVQRQQIERQQQDQRQQQVFQQQRQQDQRQQQFRQQQEQVQQQARQQQVQVEQQQRQQAQQGQQQMMQRQGAQQRPQAAPPSGPRPGGPQLSHGGPAPGH